MACQLLESFQIPDTEELVQQLFPSFQSKSELYRDDDYDNRWGWDGGDAPDVSTPNCCKILKSSHVAISPDLSLVVFGNEMSLVIYNLNSSETSTKDANVVSSKTLSGLSQNESITCIALIPVTSMESVTNCIVWWAILVGFSTGAIRAYTETGDLLHVEHVDGDSIISIKCSSPARSSYSNEGFSALTVRTDSAVIIIDGFLLYQTLKWARKQLARCGPDERVTTRSVPYKKFTLQTSSYTVINDLVTVDYSSGQVNSDKTSKSRTSMKASPSKRESSKLRVAVVGEDPFISIQDWPSNDVPSVGDVVGALLTQAKKFIPLFGQEPSDIVPSLRTSFKIGDDLSKGLQIVLSPDKKYAAVSGDDGKVTLIDVQTLSVTRALDGYVKAECAWITVSESSSKEPMDNTCLVIHDPSQGVVEVWNIENGVQIASFKVSKDCRLLAFDTFIRGQDSGTKPDSFLSACIFDFESGKCSVLDVPFVCTLTNEADQNYKTGLLVDEFKKLIINKSTDLALQVFEHIEGRAFQVEAIEFLISQFDHNSLMDVLSNVEKETSDRKIMNDVIKEYDRKLILQMITRIHSLSQLYRDLTDSPGDCPSTDDTLSLPPDIDSFATEMGWKATDVAKCISLFNLRSSVITSIEKPELINMAFSDFVSVFEHVHTQVVKNSDGEVLFSEVPIAVNWKESDKNDLRVKVSRFIFEPYFRGCFEEEHFFSLLENCHINSSCLLKLLVTCWLSTEMFRSHFINWKRLTVAMKKVAESLNETSEDNSLTPSWRSICGLIVSCPRQSSAFTAAIAVNAVLAGKMFSKSLSDDPKSLDTQDEEWETLHIDQEKLSILSKQLEDIFILDLLLKTSKTFSTEITLLSLLKSESGIVSELVAKWAVATNIKPQTVANFCNETEVAEEDSEDTVDDASEAVFIESLDMQSISDLVSHVSRRFPASMEVEVLMANCCWQSLDSWLRSPCSTGHSSLELSIEYFDSISSTNLKHNLSCLIWTNRICRINESICILIDKMAKTLSDKHCQDNLGFPEECLTSFISYSQHILDTILSNSCDEDHEITPVVVADDDYWKCSTKRGTSLMHAAANGSQSNPATVVQHLHLITIIKFINTFRLKGIKPLSFFPTSVRQFFFKDIHAKGQIYLEMNDPHIVDMRNKLMSCLTNAIAVNITMSSDLCSSFGSDRSKALLTANKWFGEVLLLSREWQLNLDLIRRRFVCDLYLNAVDDLAEEIICAVGDRHLIISDLMLIAGHRMLSLLSTCSSGTEELLSMSLHNWFRSLKKSNLRVAKASKASTKKLLELIQNEIADTGSKDYKIVTEMIESLNLIRD